MMKGEQSSSISSGQKAHAVTQKDLLARHALNSVAMSCNICRHHVVLNRVFIK